jgi:precorrin-6Y C5,15-methyltransferase (decarboxylating)
VSADVLDVCLESLRAGGRLVAHGVTVETESLLAEMHAQHGGELLRLRLEHVEPLGRYRGWAPARAVTQWAVELP